jgi:hypothetical protein
MADPQVPEAEGWFIRVTTFDAGGSPTMLRHFYVRVSDRAHAELLVKADPGEKAEAISALSKVELDGFGVAPGQVKRYD